MPQQSREDPKKGQGDAWGGLGPPELCQVWLEAPCITPVARAASDGRLGRGLHASPQYRSLGFVALLLV